MFKLATEKERVEGNLRNFPPLSCVAVFSHSLEMAAPSPWSRGSPADLEVEPESVVDTLLRESMDFCLLWWRDWGLCPRQVSDNFLLNSNREIHPKAIITNCPQPKHKHPIIIS